MDDSKAELDGDPAAAPVADLRCRDVPAEAGQLATLRRELSEWATRVGMSEEQVAALTLAGYEALANAALHAYPGDPGVLGLHATYRTESGQVEVTVTDRGRWRTPPGGQPDRGGRGLLLIENLADSAEVTTDASGTTVRMNWAVGVTDSAAR